MAREDLTPAQRAAAEQAQQVLRMYGQQLTSAFELVEAQHAALVSSVVSVQDVLAARRALVSDALVTLVSNLDLHAELSRQVVGTQFALVEQAYVFIQDFNESYRKVVHEALQAAHRTRHLRRPPNWDGFVDEWPDGVERIALDEGLALAYVPPGDIVERLLEADDRAARRRIIGQSWKRIVASTQDVLASCVGPDVAPFVRYAQRSAEALAGGHVEASQALSANLLDTILRGAAAADVRSEVTMKSEPQLEEHLPTVTLVLGGVWGSHSQFRTERGDVVPRHFSRHASVHAVGNRQYSRINAVIALMHVTALLASVDDGLLPVNRE